MTGCNNSLLTGLSDPVRQAILEASELVHLDLRENVIEPNKPMQFVDFPETGVMSLLQPMDDGSLVEIANIGSEGAVGVQLAFGVSTIGAICFCQVEGTSWRLKAATFLNLLDRYPELLVLCQRYSMTLLDQVARNAGCNRTHSTEERCARWLLQTNDRCHSDQFVLTQEFLSLMLGVSRTGVNLSAGMLSKAQLISYTRGRVKILDRKGLEEVCCGCYAALVAYSSSVMGPSGHSDVGNGSSHGLFEARAQTL